MSEKREKIIESATRMIRSGGYNSFSFREIANEVGVKSSSVHHYFPKKEDLAVVVAQRYTEGFFQALGPAEDLRMDARNVIIHYGGAFLSAYNASGKACLCGILSHESPAIPAPVNCEVASFVELNVKWLTTAFSHESGSSWSAEDVIDQARLTYTALNGAMAAATLQRDASWLTAVRDRLVSQL